MAVDIDGVEGVEVVVAEVGAEGGVIDAGGAASGVDEIEDFGGCVGELGIAAAGDVLVGGDGVEVERGVEGVVGDAA